MLLDFKKISFSVKNTIVIWVFCFFVVFLQNNFNETHKLTK